MARPEEGDADDQPEAGAGAVKKAIDQLLQTFAGSANWGLLHPNDTERFTDFLLAAYKSGQNDAVKLIEPRLDDAGVRNETWRTSLIITAENVFDAFEAVIRNRGKL